MPYTVGAQLSFGPRRVIVAYNEVPPQTLEVVAKYLLSVAADTQNPYDKLLTLVGPTRRSGFREV